MVHDCSLCYGLGVGGGGGQQWVDSMGDSVRMLRSLV